MSSSTHIIQIEFHQLERVFKIIIVFFSRYEIYPRWQQNTREWFGKLWKNAHAGANHENAQILPGQTFRWDKINNTLLNGFLPSLLRYVLPIKLFVCLGINKNNKLKNVRIGNDKEYKR